MSIKQILEELLENTVAIDDGEDTFLNTALAQIKSEMVGCNGEKKEENKGYSDALSADEYINGIVEGYNQHHTETLARIEKKFKEER